MEYSAVLAASGSSASLRKGPVQRREALDDVQKPSRQTGRCDVRVIVAVRLGPSDLAMVPFQEGLPLPRSG